MHWVSPASSGGQAAGAPGQVPGHLDYLGHAGLTERVVAGEQAARVHRVPARATANRQEASRSSA